jgi:hypothetical protein
MSEAEHEYNRMEHLLKRVRPQAPSPELKARVIRAAHNAWQDDATGIPWWIPIRRLLVSAAAALVSVSFANLYSERADAQQQGPTSTAIEPYDLDIASEAYPSLVRYAIRLDTPGGSDACALFDHLRTVQAALRETEGDDATDEPGQTNSRSHLLPSLRQGANV